MKSKKKIIIIGGNRINENNPLNAIFRFLNKYKLDYDFITSDIHLDKTSSSKLTFRDYVKSNNIKHKIVNNYNQLYSFLKKFKKNKELTILLLHSTFLIKDDIINLFKKQIFNYHLGSLPQQRGSAPQTWQTLMTKKSSKMLIHRVTNKIDRGNIILSKTLNIKKNQSLKNYYYQLQKMEYNFFKNFFINCDKNKFGQKQKENQSIYMPRLNSKIHGYINWSWNGKEIYNFIRSFDFPFSGAKTFIGRNEVTISDVHLLKKKINFHPFQSGIIFRKEKNFYFIACKDYVLKTNSIKTSEGKKINSKLLGKRLYTPYPVLDNMMTSVSVQTPSKDIVKHLRLSLVDKI